MKISSFLFQPILCFLLLILPLAAMLFGIFHFYTSFQTLHHLKEEVARVVEKNSHKESWQKKEIAFLESLKKTDHFYIDKHLESLTFLDPEIKNMQTLLVEDPLNVELSKRLKSLKEGSNRLLFIEEKTRKYDRFQEIEERQQQPVEMNEEDLKRTLSLIEGMTIWPYGPKENPPQLLILDLELIRKDTPFQDKVFLVKMDLLRREYLQK